jgi:hypothetical protein
MGRPQRPAWQTRRRHGDCPAWPQGRDRGSSRNQIRAGSLSVRKQQTVPYYFVPLDGQKPVVEKRVELVQRDVRSIYPTRTGFHATDDWIVWDLTAFNCQTHKRWTL